MSRVITYGTFDVLHWGHIKLLERAKKFGDFLIVAVSTDTFNEIKGKKSLFTFEERCKILSRVPYVDRIIAENNWEQKSKDIKELEIDTLIMGNDWEGKFDELPCEVVYLPRTEGISTELIKKRAYENIS